MKKKNWRTGLWTLRSHFSKKTPKKPKLVACMESFKLPIKRNNPELNMVVVEPESTKARHFHLPSNNTLIYGMLLRTG